MITGHPSNNVTDAIYSKIGVNLHLQPTHPIGIIKQAIYDYFDKQVQQGGGGGGGGGGRGGDGGQARCTAPTSPLSNAALL